MAAGTSGRSDRHDTSGGNEPERAAAPRAATPGAGQTGQTGEAGEAGASQQRPPLPGDGRAVAAAAPITPITSITPGAPTTPSAPPAPPAPATPITPSAPAAPSAPSAPPAPSAQATPAALAAPAASLGRLSLPARLEAILYLKGRPVPLAELAALAGIEPEEAELALITLMTDYAHRDTALEIHQEGQRFSLQLRESHDDLVQSLVPVDLSTAALRTLATIALKKRILQTELVELRGSGAYDHIKELLAQDFIERRRQSDGRSYWLSLSEKFHRTFALQTDDRADADRRRPGRPTAGDAAAS